MLMRGSASECSSDRRILFILTHIRIRILTPITIPIIPTSTVIPITADFGAADITADTVADTIGAADIVADITGAAATTAAVADIAVAVADSMAAVAIGEAVVTVEDAAGKQSATVVD